MRYLMSFLYITLSIGIPTCAGLREVVQGSSLTSIMGSNLPEYFRYEGSITLPPCIENVTLRIFKDSLSMSATQLNKFRNLTMDFSSETLVNNYRPLQPLNSRKVYTQLIQTTKSPETAQPTEPTQTMQPTETPETIQSTEPTQTMPPTKLPQPTQNTQQSTNPRPNRSVRLISSVMMFFITGVVLMPELNF